MSGSWLFQGALFIVVITVLAVVFGEYMAKVYAGEHTLISTIMGPVERLLYRCFGVDPQQEMDWREFAFNMIIFVILGLLGMLALQEIQYFLPLNPQMFKAVRLDTAINTAVSFVTNTDWQSYHSETSMSYLTQMLGMCLQNFLSAAVGMAVAVALIKSFLRKNSNSIGNFWVYLTRSILYILLPLAIILSLVLVAQGCVQNFNPYTHVMTLEGKEQVIAQGPAATQIAIKHLGTNGGGFFSANSAHPYENPTPLTDYLEILSLMLISASFPFCFGALIKNRKQGWAIFIAMMLLFIAGLCVVMWAESRGSPILSSLGVQHGVNMEGKEVRFGTFSSTFFAQATTAAGTGAVNAAHDSLMPLTGLVLIFNMAIGEVIFGGVGSGLIGMMLYAILTMFLVGLMIGRSPEIFGKKLEPKEMTLTVIALMAPCILQIVLSATAIATKAGLASLANPSSHGLSEILYAFASATGNNGSAFGGLNADTPFYNLMTAAAMLIGRFITLIPALAIAGSLARKKITPVYSRFPTASPVFVFILMGTVVLLGALTFFPVLVLGPVLEHFSLHAGAVC
jgi:potassium-transporting ATPase potassium-binding subunit